MEQHTALIDLFRQADPAHTSVILPEDGSSTTYRDLIDQVESMAARLRATGLQPGQAVAIVLPNGLEYLVAFLAVARARLVAAPLNASYKAEEFRFYFGDAGVRLEVEQVEHGAGTEERPHHDPRRELNIVCDSIAPASIYPSLEPGR